MKWQQSFWERPVYEIMKKPVESVHLYTSLKDVAHLFTERHIGAAIVINKQGKAIGVITKTDLVRHKDQNDGTKLIDEEDQEWVGPMTPRGFHLEDEEDTVSQWMTPVIFSVNSTTSLKKIAEKMVQYGIHHIFVRDGIETQILGIVSSFDILRQVSLINGTTHAPVK